MKVIYTAIFGKYDDLKEPSFVTKGWKYVCFTDQDIASPVWEIRKVPVMDCGPAKTARYYKIMFHKHIETEFSIWIDGTFIINTDLNRWWKRFKEPFTAAQHPYDNCIYKDAESCMSAGKGHLKTIERQIALYKVIGIRKNSGLIASGMLMRQKTEAVKKFCKAWWNQVDQWSERDQIAWGYANFLNPGVVNKIKWNYQEEREFWHVPHLHKKHRTLPTEKQLYDYGKLQSEQG